MASQRVVGFVGLDDLSLEIASILVGSGFHVQGYETYGPVKDQFVKLGGAKCASPIDAAKDAAIIFVCFSQEDQGQNILFGMEGVLKGLHKDAVIIFRSTGSPLYIQMLEKCLMVAGTDAIVDAYVFKGVSKSLNGKILFIGSGRKEAIAKAKPFLSAVGGKLFIHEGELGVASKIGMVIELLEGIHLAASIEAMFLGTHAGLHPWILYNIISNAAGNSWTFANCVPFFLQADAAESQYLNVLVNNLGCTLNLAKSLPFPLPLLSVAYQQLIYGSSCNLGDSGDLRYTKLIETQEKALGVNIRAASQKESYDPLQLADQMTMSPYVVKRIGFIGLGAMGFGMATRLLKSEFCVIGYDAYKPTMSRFALAGGLVGSSPAEVSKDVDVLIIMVANEVQVESVLYGEEGSVSALPTGVSIILSSTVSPGYVQNLEKRLQDENKNLKLVDAPVSGGVKRADDGTLTIIASGTDEAFKCTGSILRALSEKLYIIKGSCGNASCVKMVNQLLAGVHIAASAEAMAFGARMGLNTRILFEAVTNSRGTSWMFENRVPHMLSGDYTPLSALDIFVKDLGIVCHEGATRKFPVLVSAVAHQLFIAGSASGWGRIDDSGVVKVYETFTGAKVEATLPILKKEDILNSLPSEWPEDPINDIHEMEWHNVAKILVVLDDDPTGTQTVHDVDVLTEWNVESLVEQFSKRSSCFFILTNSRSLSPEKAISLLKNICINIKTAAELVENIDYTVVLRGDSTLRGHFPEEADAVVSVLGEMDAWIICPFFLQGGRYTIEDIHFVGDADRLVPAGQTEFSKDAAFGYNASNLREWVEEKMKGRIQANDVASISIQLLRKGGPTAVCKHLCSLSKGSICIVNAASERDVAVFAEGMIQAEKVGKHFLCRTAASFVSARIGIKTKAPISPKEIGLHKERNGGLIVVGSYVPKTSRQVEELKSHCSHILKCIEVSVDKLAMKTQKEREEEISYAAAMADAFLKARKDTLVMTSRELIKGNSPSESLEINFRVSSALVEIVKRISTRPRYILAKGGITSSDLATKALEAKRARVVGQALAGVPLWQLGSESRYPGIPYIVFPGNVGGDNAVAEVVRSWASIRRPSTKDLLLDAEKGGYAIGAFNVYNLEGLEAVVSAAEEEKSAAILQIHPTALKQGGIPLVASCTSAAEHANVPITVHFDHGTSKNELLQTLEMGFDSVMADGSHLPFDENVSYTKEVSFLAHSNKILVEAELGRLSGTEDGLTVDDYEARLTDVTQAQEFIEKTGIDALAVCIGNVHGKYPASGPNLRLDLLKDLHSMTTKKGVALVLHGASGLPAELIKECIKLGVRKFNVNTEVRNAYLESLREPKKDLIHVMASAKEAMKTVVAEKMRLFGSAGKAA